MAAANPDELVLVPFTAEALPKAEPWFDDPETRRWLEDRKWPAMALRLATEPPVERRGKRALRRETFLAMENGSPVALADTEMYQDGTASFAFVVEPSRRGRGVCRRVALALRAYLADQGVHELFAGAEPDNLASIRCLEAAGFRPRSELADSEGFLYFACLLST